ncbi:MAG: winged helix-turn-helix domain-containing protein [Azospirillaceae bacterium]
MTYRFDRFEFSHDRGLFEDGRPVALEPRALSLLDHLLANRHRVVTRDELVERLWNGRAITDAALSTQIRTVRRALGDDRNTQRFLRTYPKRGFEFVADVEVVENGQDAASPAARPGPARPAGIAKVAPRRVMVGAAFALLVVLLAGAIGAAWLRDTASIAFAEPPRKHSIVVLPFDNLSSDPGLDYLADAFTEDLVTDLSRIRDTFVISRSTTFTYRGTATDAATVAAELGVRYVLEGSVRVDGGDVRINAQLIDGETNAHVWSDRYRRRLEDLFSVQDNVTGRIASVMRAELKVADSRRQDPEATRDAWDSALRGNVILYNHQSISDYQTAHALLTRAIDLDPTISSAWSGLAFVHYVASQAAIPGVSAPDSATLSLEAARKATEHDPRNAEGYWLLGAGYARIGQPERGMTACETAMDLNPNMDCAYVCAGLVNMALGRPLEAVPFFEYALRLNPQFRPFTKEKYLGLAFIQSGEDDRAIEVLNRALAGAPKDLFANLALASALGHAGRVDEAADTLAKARDLAPEGATSLSAVRERYGWMGPDVERMLEGLRIASAAG